MPSENLYNTENASPTISPISPIPTHSPCIALNTVPSLIYFYFFFSFFVYSPVYDNRMYASSRKYTVEISIYTLLDTPRLHNLPLMYVLLLITILLLIFLL